MSNHKNLLFFNKEGDYLNFNYNEITDRFEGDILFHESSTDVYKTAGLYLLEKVPSFEFEAVGDLKLNKFQLFNEYGLNFYGAKFTNQKIVNIEPINGDPGFYSKWIYGDDFDIKFPVGTIVKFDNTLLEFSNLYQTYTVVATKKGAIMIITQTNNSIFETNYFSQYTNEDTYIDKKISGVNAIGVYNYINSLFQDNLSTWNEPSFYDKLYKKKKINIVNTEKNDSTVTIKEENITDLNHFEYTVSPLNLPSNEPLIIEVVSKTDLPRIYNGGIDISQITITLSQNAGQVQTIGLSSSNTGVDGVYLGLTASGISSVSGNGATINVVISGGLVTGIAVNNPGLNYSDTDVFIIDGTDVGGTSIVDDIVININSVTQPYILSNKNVIKFDYSVPEILKPGREFKIIGSTNNQNFFTVKNIPTFNGNTQQTFYGTQSQVLFNNRIYECLQAYTQSFSGPTQFVTPEDTDYWSSNISYLEVDQTITPEYLSTCQLYLTTDRLLFEYGWTFSSSVTLASAGERYASDLRSFNIDLYYTNNKLRADLIYPSQYAEVNFYKTKVGPTYSIGQVTKTFERLTEVVEQLNYELNYDLSSNFKVNIVFTDLDEYGLKVIIDKQVYEEEIAWVYSGTGPDMARTIDRTLRAWLSRNYFRLASLGIIPTLNYIGSYTSPFYNAISIRTEYPNVPMTIQEVKVGITANFHIEHSRVLFTDLGPNLNITINGSDYEQQTIYLSGTSSQYPNIPATLQSWVEEHGEYLREFGILVSNINNLLKFDVNQLERRLDYQVNIGKSSLPGKSDYTITKKLTGNDGCLITSNEIRLSATSSNSFEQVGFATGMVVSVNNTFYPWNNQEYNLQFIDPQVMNLSYQGPFWSTTPAICNSSGFITLAFELGFGQTGCFISPTSGTGGTGSGSLGGPFDLQAFSSAFSFQYNPNTYVVNNYNLSNYPGTSNMVDIKYVQLSNTIYGFGDDLIAIDAYGAFYMSTISLPGNTQSIEMKYNVVNNYLYCLSRNTMWVIDPLINSVVTSMTFSENASSIEINSTYGDIYVSYENINSVRIYNSNNILVSSISTAMGSGFNKMVFNEFEGDVYITDLNGVIRVDGPTRTVATTYNIIGATNSIFYEPVNESIYVFDQNNLWKIDNGITYSIIGVTTGSFNDIIFNNLTGQMNLSDSSGKFRALDLSSNTISISVTSSNYGYLALNQFDGDVYLSSLATNTVTVINPTNGISVHTESLSAGTTKIIYNPERNSIWAIQPSIGSLIEIEVELGSTININPSTYSQVEEFSYGTLDKDYVPRPDLWIKSKEYVRRPRENFQGEAEVKYYYRWYSDNIPQFFLYDYSGDQLPATGSSYAYVGERPLKTAVLNKSANRDLTKVTSPEYQQTVFDKVEYKLSYIDDEDDVSIEAEPIQTFIGFKSENEGALRSILQLWKKEDITVNYESNSTNGNILSFETLDPNGPDKRGQIKINVGSTEEFINKGFKEGQHIAIYVRDITNQRNQFISNNNGLIVKIRSVFFKTLVVDFLNSSDNLFLEQTVMQNFPTSGKTTYLRTTIKVIDKEIGRFYTFGQTEIEDIRFKTELGNVGKSIAPNEVFIFKDYDILEGGIDWTFMNKKRKEMLMMKHLIFPYIGAYKSIINAINFFGYNDLQLNEYYRDINPNSERFFQLFKVEIPDIFDNTVEGWTESEFVKNNFPNENYEETNMFNLTYFITDKEGNKKINYSIDEVVIKLQGLKYWLKRNIIPLTHKIMDITGVSYFRGENQITHTSYDLRIIKSRENMTPITFKLNEAYLMPVNSGSTVYNCVIDFYSIIEGIGADKNPTGLLSPPKPYNESELILPDYFDVTVRTYKTYKEWFPFTTYDLGDKITYFGRLYESATSSNKVKNPRKYENASSWSVNSVYEVTNIVEYNRDIYVYSGLGIFATSSGTQSATSSIPPNIDTQNWMKITEWKEIDYEPVQTLKEFRRVPKRELNIPTDSTIPPPNPLLPFNFTIDSNIDPFIVIEVTSDNGYGAIYRDRKNYEIRGIKDLREPMKYIDPIGPFVPISPIY